MSVIQACRSCKAATLVPVLSMGRTPLANALLTHRPDEDDRAFRFKLHFLHGPSHSQHGGQPAAVITDAGAAHQLSLTSNLHVSAGRENGIEVVTGVNLPMLVKLGSLAGNSLSLQELATGLTEAGQKSIR